MHFDAFRCTADLRAKMGSFFQTTNVNHVASLKASPPLFIAGMTSTNNPARSAAGRSEQGCEQLRTSHPSARRADARILPPPSPNCRGKAGILILQPNDSIPRAGGDLRCTVIYSHLPLECYFRAARNQKIQRYFNVAFRTHYLIVASLPTLPRWAAGWAI